MEIAKLHPTPKQYDSRLRFRSALSGDAGQGSATVFPSASPTGFSVPRLRIILDYEKVH
jgi:hypothetical protein